MKFIQPDITAESTLELLRYCTFQYLQYHIIYVD